MTENETNKDPQQLQQQMQICTWNEVVQTSNQHKALVSPNYGCEMHVDSCGHESGGIWWTI